MADGVAADEVADLFGEVLGVIAGALKRLGHEDDLQKPQRLKARLIVRACGMPEGIP